MWNRFRIDKKLGIERKYINIAIVVVLTGIALFASYEIISRSGTYFMLLGSVISKFFRVIRPIIIGAVIAYLLYPGVMLIEKYLKKFAAKRNIMQNKEGKNRDWVFRITSVILVFLLMVLVVVLIFMFIIPPLLESGKALINNIPQYNDVVNNGVNKLNKYFATLNVDSAQVSKYVSKVTSIFAFAGEGLVNGLTNFIQGIGSFVVDFVLSFIFAFYFLKDKEMLFRTIKKFLGVFLHGRAKEKFKQFILDTDEIVGAFIKGVLCDAIIVAIVSSILLLIIGHPFAILVGIIAGICNIVPYVGPLVGELTAFLLGIFASITTGIWGFIVLMLYQQVDGNIIQPKIVGGNVGLAPVWTLIALTIGGGYAGVVGMVCAVPVAAMLNVYINRYYKRKEEAKALNSGVKEIKESGNSLGE